MKYEKPEIIDFQWAEAMGNCATGSGDTNYCINNGNAAESACYGGNEASNSCDGGNAVN